MSAEELIAAIKKYGLEPATKREISLLTLSLLAQGYCVLVRRLMGFSYEAIATVGSGRFWHTLINEQRIANLTEKFIDNKNEVSAVLDKAYMLLGETKRQIELAGSNPVSLLAALINAYPQYLAAIGVYNCFWRYIGDKTQTKCLLK